MNIVFPARKANGVDYANLKEIMGCIGREPHGFWLAETSQMWHGGIHLTEVTAPGAVPNENNTDKALPLQCMIDGEIVAWRINRDYLTSDYCGNRVQYSSTFLLVKSVYKPEQNNANDGFEFYSLYMGLAPLSVFPKYSRYRVTEQGDGVRLRHYNGQEMTGQLVPAPTGSTLGKGARVLIFGREMFVLQGKEEPFGLAQPLNDGKPKGAKCWVSLRDGYLEEDGDEYDSLPDWMAKAVIQGIFDRVVIPSTPLPIKVRDAVGFLAYNIVPQGECQLLASNFAHIEVLCNDMRISERLTDPGNVNTATLLERDKSHPTESRGKTFYQIESHSRMPGYDADEAQRYYLNPRELYMAVHHQDMEMRELASRLVVRHDSEWFGGSVHHRGWAFLQKDDVQRIDYLQKWLDECEWMSQVPAFSSGEAVLHMHPVVFLDAIRSAVKILKGQLTYNAEGNDIPSSKYYSRVIHWPGNSLSGVTLGRGYDMGDRSEREVYSDMIASGIADDQALKISKGAKLKGNNARDFVLSRKEIIGEITLQQQESLFSIIYPLYIKRTINNYNKWTDGVLNVKPWEVLDYIIQDVLVDFVYQGFTKGPKPMLAGSNNNKYELISYIKNTPAISQYEPGRHRADYLAGDK